MEPPGADVPRAGHDLAVDEPAVGTAAGSAGTTDDDPADALRLIAAVAAIALALATKGNAFLLGGLLAVAVGGAPGAVAVLAACAASAVRWGSASLDAAAGAQAVLGPAVVVGSTAASVSALLAGVALVLCARELRTAPALGLAAAAVAAGPMVPHDLGVRLLGAILGVALAVGATRLPRRTSALAALIACGALVLAAAA